MIRGPYEGGIADTPTVAIVPAAEPEPAAATAVLATDDAEHRKQLAVDEARPALRKLHVRYVVDHFLARVDAHHHYVAQGSFAAGMVRYVRDLHGSLVASSEKLHDTSDDVDMDVAEAAEPRAVRTIALHGESDDELFASITMTSHEGMVASGSCIPPPLAVSAQELVRNATGSSAGGDIYTCFSVVDTTSSQN